MTVFQVALQQTSSASAVDSIGKSVELGTLIMAGGWLMVPLILLFGYAIFIYVERRMLIRRAGRIDIRFMNQVKDLMYEGKIGVALALCRNTDSPLARMIEKGLEHLGRPLSEVHSSIENTANLEISKLEHNLSFLATIAGGAPMIGFLGTVIGMVEAFMNLSQAGGAVDLSLLSSGMYTAMITTVAGLVVGIPAYFGYNFLVHKIDKLVFQMEASTIAFMDILNQPVQENNK